LAEPENPATADGSDPEAPPRPATSGRGREVGDPAGEVAGEPGAPGGQPPDPTGSGRPHGAGDLAGMIELAKLRPGFAGLMGLHLDEISSRRVTAHLNVGEEHLQPFGLVHGGVYAAIGETLASIGAAVALHERSPGQTVVGLENHTSFLRAARVGERIEAEALPRHAGRRTQQWEVRMRRGDGAEVAVSTVRLLALARAEV